MPLSRPNRAAALAVIQRTTTPAAAKVVRRALGVKDASDWCQYVLPRTDNEGEPHRRFDPSYKCPTMPRYRVVVKYDTKARSAGTFDCCQTHALRLIGDAASHGIAYDIRFAPGREPDPS